MPIQLDIWLEKLTKKRDPLEFYHLYRSPFLVQKLTDTPSPPDRLFVHTICANEQIRHVLCVTMFVIETLGPSANILAKKEKNTHEYFECRMRILNTLSLQDGVTGRRVPVMKNKRKRLERGPGPFQTRTF